MTRCVSRRTSVTLGVRLLGWQDVRARPGGGGVAHPVPVRPAAYSIPSFFSLYRSARKVIPRAAAVRVLL